MDEPILNENTEKAQSGSNLSITSNDIKIDFSKEFLVELRRNMYHGTHYEDVVDHIAKDIEKEISTDIGGEFKFLEILKWEFLILVTILMFDGKLLVWFSQCIPSYTFVLWMAILGKLQTQDRIFQWNSDATMKCSLCNLCIDSHDHLFFQCKYATDVWEVVKDNRYLKGFKPKWIDTVNHMTVGHCKAIKSVVSRIVFGSVDIPLVSIPRTHPGGPCRALTARKSVRPLPSHRLALRTPRCSEAYLRWSSAPLSTMYPPMTSESSARDSSSESSAGSSRKRCRSPAATVTSSILATRALVPSRVDLLPPRKRFRDSTSPDDSVEEDCGTKGGGIE
ncbi:putative reverse transcriptase domain-containing protein [Tanacetum coccineum]